MSHIQLTLNTKDDIGDILIAELSAIGFDSFLEETDDTIIASISSDDFKEDLLKEIIDRYNKSFTIEYSFEEVAPQNWNKLWESNYPYVIINDRCAIRAEFHTLPRKYEYEISITPKMSFGTGHHATTTLMLQTIMEYNFQDKSVLDLGSGTGVIFILASMLGANKAKACDIEEWAVENAIENAEKNSIENFSVFQGTVIEEPSNNLYDYVCANINKNVILSEIPLYVERLKDDGVFITSGFYEHDIPDIINKAKENNLEVLHTNTLNNWAVCVFKKS